MRKIGKLIKVIDLAILRLTMRVVVDSIAVELLSLADHCTATGVTFFVVVGVAVAVVAVAVLVAGAVVTVFRYHDGDGVHHFFPRQHNVIVYIQQFV